MHRHLDSIWIVRIMYYLLIIISKTQTKSESGLDPSDFWIFLNLTIPLSTKHLYNICTMLDQRRRRWADVICYTKMLYKCFVFAGFDNLIEKLNLIKLMHHPPQASSCIKTFAIRILYFKADHLVFHYLCCFKWQALSFLRKFSYRNAK